MRKSEGNIMTPAIECVNPKKNKWRVRWAYESKKDDNDNDNEGVVTFMEEDFNHYPDVDSEIKPLIIGWYNAQIDKKIISGFTYKGKSVWLSQENQFNYKAAYDLAVQTEGRTLPVIFKFGTDDQPEYHEFTELNELSEFYILATQYVQNTLSEGWKLKDNINFNVYKIH